MNIKKVKSLKFKRVRKDYYEASSDVIYTGYTQTVKKYLHSQFTGLWKD